MSVTVLFLSMHILIQNRSISTLLLPAPLIPMPRPSPSTSVKRSLSTESNSKSATLDFEQYKRRRIHSQGTVLARNHGIDMYTSSNGLLRKQSTGVEVLFLSMHILIQNISLK